MPTFLKAFCRTLKLLMYSCSSFVENFTFFKIRTPTQRERERGRERGGGGGGDREVREGRHNREVQWNPSLRTPLK